MHYKNLTPNIPHSSNLPHIIWGHGWNQSHSYLLPIASGLQNLAVHWLLDFPGFGASKSPDNIWGVKDYTDETVQWIAKHIPNTATKIWVGHSFGGRVGINLAAKHPTLIKGLFLIASSGIPKPRRLTEKMIIASKVKVFKSLKFLIKCLNNDNYSNWLKTKFGSTDYKNASPTMRAILVKIVNENLTTEATKILCPTELVYGECDTETPIIMGQILNKLINNSILHIIPKENHYSVLSATQHQVIYLLKNFINKVLC